VFATFGCNSDPKLYISDGANAELECTCAVRDTSDVGQDCRDARRYLDEQGFERSEDYTTSCEGGFEMCFKYRRF
jgi:hypothetical protein